MQSDVNQLKHIPLRQRGSNILVSPANEVIKWQAKGNMTIELDKVYPAQGISIDFGKPDVSAWGVLEVSADGKQWRQVEYQQNKNRIGVKLDKAPLKAVRFSNTSDQEQEIYLRNFTVTVER